MPRSEWAQGFAQRFRAHSFRPTLTELGELVRQQTCLEVKEAPVGDGSAIVDLFGRAKGG